MNKKMLIASLMFVLASSGELFAFVKKAAKSTRKAASATGKALSSETAQQVYLGVGTLGMANAIMATDIALFVDSGNDSFSKKDYPHASRMYIAAIAFIRQNGGSPAGQPSQTWLWNRVKQCLNLSIDAVNELESNVDKAFKAVAMASVKNDVRKKVGETCWNVGLGKIGTTEESSRYFEIAKALGYSKEQPKLTGSSVNPATP